MNNEKSNMPLLREVSKEISRSSKNLRRTRVMGRLTFAVIFLLCRLGFWATRVSREDSKDKILEILEEAGGACRVPSPAHMGLYFDMDKFRVGTMHRAYPPVFKYNFLMKKGALCTNNFLTACVVARLYKEYEQYLDRVIDGALHRLGVEEFTLSDREESVRVACF